MLYTKAEIQSGNASKSKPACRDALLPQVALSLPSDMLTAPSCSSMQTFVGPDAYSQGLAEAVIPAFNLRVC